MKKVVFVLALVLLASAPAFADRVIYNGSDL